MTPKGLLAYLIAQQRGDEDAESVWQDAQNDAANDDYQDFGGEE